MEGKFFGDIPDEIIPIPSLVDRFQNNVARCVSEAKPDQSASVPSEEVMVKPWPTRED
jgi:hypothetical protein